MRKLFHLCIFCVTICKSTIGFTQDDIEGLKAKVAASENDLQRVENTFKLLIELRKEDPDSALILALENLVLAEATGNQQLLADTNHQLGLIYRSLYNYEKALVHYQKALAITIKNGLVDTQTKVFGNMSYLLGNMGRGNEAIAYRFKELNLLKQVDNKSETAWCYYNLGLDYKHVGSLDSAELYLNQAIVLSEDKSFSEVLIKSYNVLGNMLSDEGRIVEGLVSYQKALKIAEDVEDSLGITDVLGNIAIVHKRQSDFEKAKRYYRRSIDIGKKINDVYVHITLFNMGVLYLDLNEYDSALSSFQDAFVIRKKIGSIRYQVSNAAMLADTYDLMGHKDSSQYYVDYVEQLIPQVQSPLARASAWSILGNINLRRNNLSTAESQLLLGYDLYTQLHANDGLADISKALHELYRSKGDLSKSLISLEEYVQLTDRLFNEEKVREVTRLEENYKYDKKILEKENELRLLEAKDQLRLLLFIGAAIIILMAGYFIARARVRAKSLRARQLEEIGKFKEAMTGMIAHDLKNPLSIILNNKDVEKNQYTAKQMLQLINNMLDVQKFEAARMPLNLQKTNLKSLVTSAKEQVDLLAKQSNVSVTSDVPEATVWVDSEIIDRVLVNLLTNAIKYSTLNSEVVIKGEIAENQLMLSVVDYGEGIPQEQQHLIFEPYGQLDPKMAGGIGSTGLGLSFCKLAIEAHGSALILKSETEKGSDFSFTMKLIETDDQVNVEWAQEKFLTLTTGQQKRIAACLPELKKLNLYQISEIENELSTLKSQENQAIDQWVDAILDATYTGNKEKYNELLDSVKRKNPSRKIKF